LQLDVTDREQVAAVAATVAERTGVRPVYPDHAEPFGPSLAAVAGALIEASR
jgi:NAD(P)-dependent dehydrogenase (short-subunit alcohol dehydrogenase family)